MAKKMTTKVLCFLVIIVIFLSVMPVSVFAVQESSSSETVSAQGDQSDCPSVVKFKGTATTDEKCCSCYGSYYCKVKVEELLSNPGNKLKSGNVYPVCYGDSPKNIKPGDKLEVYGEYFHSCGALQQMGNIITFNNNYYIKKISSESHSINVWTDKSEYKIGETVKIYYQTNKKCTAKLTITKPDGGKVVYGPNEIPACTRSKSATAGYPTGKRTVVFEAWAGGKSKKATCYFDVVEKKKPKQPSPEIIKVEYPTACVKEDEYATISVTVANNGGASSEGYISVSFPNDEDVYVVSGTGNEYNKVYLKGSEIWGKDGKIPSSKDPLVELFDTNWGKYQQETITMKAKPNSGSDKIEFLVRAALKNADGSYERDPTYTGYKDQQGWYVKKYSVDVCEYEVVKIRGKIIADHPAISYYNFDVEIDEVLEDPTGKLQEGETVTVYGHRSGPALVDVVTVGDEVEVFGEYRGYVGTYEQIFLSEWGESSSDHYVKKIEEKPAPEIVEVKYPPACVKEGDAATISVTVKNNGGASSEGYISVSFPNGEDVSVVSGTGNGYNKLYQKESVIWGKDGIIPSSKDPLVDLLDTNWVKYQQETITMSVKPNSGSDEIVFYVRAALKNADGSYERDPLYSGYKDQQGWCVERHVIDVCPKEACVIIDDDSCVGYEVYVDGASILTEGVGEILDGYCTFPVTEGTHTIEIHDNSRYAAITRNFEGTYTWDSMPDNWCKGNAAVKFRGVIVKETQPISFYNYKVKIEDILEDPSDVLNLGDEVWMWAHADGPAKVDSVSKDDKVEVSGTYDGELHREVKLETGEHYLRALKVSVIIDDDTCVGYEVWVDGAYKLTNGDGDGYCSFSVTEGTHTIEIRDNGCSASITRIFEGTYTWNTMPDNWCKGNAAVKFKGTIVKDSSTSSFFNYKIKINDVLTDPSDVLNPGDEIWVWAVSGGSSQVDSVSIDDKVEVYGTYDGESRREVKLETAEHTLKKDNYVTTTFTNTIGMEFVLIPAGEFDMGSPPDEAGRDSNEGPVHHVTLGYAFYMGRYEVTQQQWREIMGDNPSYFKGDDLPVELVSWDNAQNFIKKLNEKEGRNKYRLPSEAEWEYACRAGTTTRYSFGDDESKLGEYAWYLDNSGGKTHPVGQKKPNPWGLYDMHGNVWEWVQDCIGRPVGYNGAPTDGSAWVTSPDDPLSIRSGGWTGSTINCRSADRYWGSAASCTFGFRLVCSLPTTAEVKFRGVIVKESLQTSFYILLNTIKIDEILMDPSDVLNSGDEIWVFSSGPATVDDVSIGDKVEVYGKYDGELYRAVKLETAEHYLKNLGSQEEKKGRLTIEKIDLNTGCTPKDIKIPGSFGYSDLSGCVARQTRDRNPSVAKEGQIFYVTVKAKAHDSDLQKGQIYVVLVPPTEQTGVYCIERTQEPDKISKDELGLWEFKVTCLKGKIEVKNVDLMGHFGKIGVLTIEPNIFAFRAFAFTAFPSDQSELRSIPVISVKDVDFREEITESLKNELINKVTENLYSLLEIESYTVAAFDTLNDAWNKAIENDKIFEEAKEDSRKTFLKVKLEELYANQQPGSCT